MYGMTRLSEAALPCTLYLIIRVYFKAANVACASLGPSSLQLPLSLFFELTFLSGLVSLLMFHSLFFSFTVGAFSGLIITARSK